MISFTPPFSSVNTALTPNCAHHESYRNGYPAQERTRHLSWLELHMFASVPAV